MASVYTVAQVTSYISHLFEEDFALKRISIQGEISNCKKHSGGHLYFTLKDETSTLSCVMFASNRAKLTFIPSEGMRVIARGSVRIYERDGVYQLYVTQLEPAGVGEWFRLFEERKAQFEEMGMFSEEYKKPIPRFAKKVGVVTAKTGAAIQDIRNISYRRNPYLQIILYPALVQGEGAADSIVHGIHMLDQAEVDVIIVGRGGGSIEDLWAFNEEKVARAIFECRTPIISAVGHETDFTIADFVADLRAPTPSAAAELAVADFRQILQNIAGLRDRMQKAMQRRAELGRAQLMQYQMRFQYLNPEAKLRDNRQRLADLDELLRRAMKNRIAEERHMLGIYLERYRGLSPLYKLNQGYSFVSDREGNGIISTKQVHSGDLLEISVTDGVIEAEVRSSRKEDWNK